MYTARKTLCLSYKYFELFLVKIFNEWWCNAFIYFMFIDMFSRCYDEIKFAYQVNVKYLIHIERKNFCACDSISPGRLSEPIKLHECLCHSYRAVWAAQG